MNHTGIGPTLVVSTDTRSSLITPCAVGRIVSEIPSRMLNVASVAMIEGILTADQAGVDEAEGDAAQEDDADPEQDLRGSLGADQERGDDDPEADHAADGEVEVADEERVGLRHGDDDQGQGQDEDL